MAKKEKKNNNIKVDSAKKEKKKIKIGFLGGVGEIGKNMTLVEYGDNIVIIDAGMSFPDEDTPGIDAIIPDFTYLRNNRSKIRGVLLTHGHEDHIGALPYFLEEFQVPVYGSEVTLALVEAKLQERKVSAKLIKVQDGEQVLLSPFTVEFFHVCHSVAGSFAIAVTTPQGTVFHTGDYKFDYTPVDGQPMDLARFGALGEKGVLLMLGESTNIEREGYTVSEQVVGDTFDKIFAENVGRRIFVATFASNISRLQQIVDVASKYGRKIAFGGKSITKVADISRDLGLLTIDEKQVVAIEKANRVPDGKMCIIVTGSQGEPLSALTRMSVGDYGKIQLGYNDTVIISASPIPGNEKSVYTVIDNIYRLGAKVCYHTLKDIHVSGHAHKEELKLMLSLIKPKYFLPVHGEYRHQVRHRELACSLGIPEQNTMIAEIGWAVDVGEDLFSRSLDIPAGCSYIDGNLVGADMDSVIEERKVMSRDGVIIIICQFNGKSTVDKDVDVLARGIVLSDEYVQNLKKQVALFIRDKKVRPSTRKEIRERLTKLAKSLARKMLKTSPMVIPIVVTK